MNLFLLLLSTWLLIVILLWLPFENIYNSSIWMNQLIISQILCWMTLVIVFWNNTRLWFDANNHNNYYLLHVSVHVFGLVLSHNPIPNVRIVVWAESLLSETSPATVKTSTRLMLGHHLRCWFSINLAACPRLGLPFNTLPYNYVIGFGEKSPLTLHFLYSFIRM